MGRAALLALLLLCVTTASAQTNVTHAPAQPWKPLNDGEAVVSTGEELLAALDQNVGNITLARDIYLNESDWQNFTLPILIDAPNRTVLVHAAPGEHRVLDWGHAQALLKVSQFTTLALDGLDSMHPGNRTKGIETLGVEIKGSGLWPTVVGEDGHKAVVSNGSMQIDNAKCNPEFVQVEVRRIQELISNSSGVPGLGERLAHYVGGVTMHYVNVTFPAPLYNLLTKQQEGKALYTLLNLTTACYDSSYVYSASTDGGGSGGGGGGTPSWVWGLVGGLCGAAALAAAGAALLWRRRHRRQHAAAAAAAGGGSIDEEQGSKLSSAEALAPLPSSAGVLGSYDKALSAPLSSGGRLSGTTGSGELHSLLRTRFGPIDGLQLGELLGRGAFGRVYRGRWKGAIVAVKVVEHCVQPGKTQDLSREPLLSMSLSHPHVVQTHKMCVVKLKPGPAAESEAEHLDAAAAAASSSSGSGGRAPHHSGSGGRLVPAIDGSGGMVEVISPTDVLQPGLYETWLVCEYCDRGSLADLIGATRGRLSADPAQRDVFAVLCLLDVALGLEYLHSNTIVHGDLKPANVMLKAARNDRRGFVCKLGDFGLSRMLAQDQSHVQTQSYGTASYAAPELISQGKLTPSADIYSLGIVMWELVAHGAELYPGLTAMQLILQVSQHQARPDLPADCPQGLAELMQRCWHADPAQRPTADQVVDELRRLFMAMRPPPAQQAAGPRPPAAATAAAAAAPGSAPT